MNQYTLELLNSALFVGLVAFAGMLLSRALVEFVDYMFGDDD